MMLATVLPVQDVPLEHYQPPTSTLVQREHPRRASSSTTTTAGIKQHKPSSRHNSSASSAAQSFPESTELAASNKLRISSATLSAPHQHAQSTDAATLAATPAAAMVRKISTSRTTNTPAMENNTTTATTRTAIPSRLMKPMVASKRPIPLYDGAAAIAALSAAVTVATQSASSSRVEQQEDEQLLLPTTTSPAPPVQQAAPAQRRIVRRSKSSIACVSVLAAVAATSIAPSSPIRESVEDSESSIGRTIAAAELRAEEQRKALEELRLSFHQQRKQSRVRFAEDADGNLTSETVHLKVKTSREDLSARRFNRMYWSGEQLQKISKSAKKLAAEQSVNNIPLVRTIEYLYQSGEKYYATGMGGATMGDWEETSTSAVPSNSYNNIMLETAQAVRHNKNALLESNKNRNAHGPLSSPVHSAQKLSSAVDTRAKLLSCSYHMDATTRLTEASSPICPTANTTMSSSAFTQQGAILKAVRTIVESNETRGLESRIYTFIRANRKMIIRDVVSLQDKLRSSEAPVSPDMLANMLAKRSQHLTVKARQFALQLAQGDSMEANKVFSMLFAETSFSDDPTAPAEEEEDEEATMHYKDVSDDSSELDSGLEDDDDSSPFNSDEKENVDDDDDDEFASG